MVKVPCAEKEGILILGHYAMSWGVWSIAFLADAPPSFFSKIKIISGKEMNKGTNINTIRWIRKMLPLTDLLA